MNLTKFFLDIVYNVFQVLSAQLTVKLNSLLRTIMYLEKKRTTKLINYVKLKKLFSIISLFVKIYDIKSNIFKFTTELKIIKGI